eukprot:CAMPEP_0180618390 /NCGR_PEP_ID=MMETSP1037_2-20121125/33545_1 /TAXON_ID=632150 /ORGANISM="Azadinium spinosum, Strain 3D9" /LENGTH=68 /DNA_ID=CAMNT_0022638407 /DNA_START=1176 /DNA_END=1382 /DNA_ORIENTATION=+
MAELVVDLQRGEEALRPGDVQALHHGGRPIVALGIQEPASDEVGAICARKGNLPVKTRRGRPCDLDLL